MSPNSVLFIFGLVIPSAFGTIDKRSIDPRIQENLKELQVGKNAKNFLKPVFKSTEQALENYNKIMWSCICNTYNMSHSKNISIQPEWKIYYNITTNQTIDIIDSNNPRIQYYKSKATAKILRIGFGPIPCTCQGLTCGCCAGMKIKYFNFDRTACMNFTYDPYEFSLSLDMLMNNSSLFAQSISGKNPPPACLPVPIPYGPPIDFCVKFFNIHTPGLNLFMCMDFETRITRAPILILHFDCMQMGVDGVHHHKPEDAELGPDIEDADVTTSEIEVYDEVFEEDNKNKTEKTDQKPSEKDN